MKPPKEKLLEYEILNGQLKKVLLYHSTDRWYFGDFIRHSTWLSCLHAINPDSLELVTAGAYLPLYSDGRVHKLHDISEFDAGTLVEFDLVVIPSAYPPDVYDTSISRAIYTWDRGWAYVRYGLEIEKGSKQELNYFITARHKEQTALPKSDVFPVLFSPGESDETETALRELFGDERPIIVYNPTASNPFTRETDIKKEVDNSLTISEHGIILRRLQRILPGYNFLVGSAVKPGDELNEAAIRGLATEADPSLSQVKAIFDLSRISATSIRGFASALASERVLGMIGAGTGTNTHLASLVGLPAFSIERSADDAMIDNWKQPEQFQMGSFRWRNPAANIAIYCLDWRHKSEAELERIADAFAVHLKSVHGEIEGVIQNQTADKVRGISRDILRSLGSGDVKGVWVGMSQLLSHMSPEAVQNYGYFSDEMQYLRLQDDRLSGVSNIDDLMSMDEAVLSNHVSLIVQLIQFTNLYKLCIAYAADTHSKPHIREVDLIFKKIRAGHLLVPRELDLLGVNDDQELAAIVNAGISSSIYPTLHSRVPTVSVAGWQHTVDIYDDIVVKSIETNPLSEYLTDAYTMEGVKTALESSGGNIPPSLLHKNKVISKRLNLFIASDGSVPLYGAALQSDVELPYGWVKEQLDRHLALLRRGVLNFDLKLADAGISRYGVMYVADFSVFRYSSEDVLSSDRNPRTNIVRLAFGELVQNGQVLLRFKNGDELLRRYDADLKKHLGVSVGPLADTWSWGDHEMSEHDEAIDTLKRRIEAYAAENEHKIPVYGIVNESAEEIAYQLLSDRLSNR